MDAGGEASEAGVVDLRLHFSRKARERPFAFALNRNARTQSRR